VLLLSKDKHVTSLAAKRTTTTIDSSLLLLQRAAVRAGRGEGGAARTNLYTVVARPRPPHHVFGFKVAERILPAEIV